MYAGRPGKRQRQNLLTTVPRLTRVTRINRGVKDDLIELIPDTGLGTTFATIRLPAACPIGTSVPIFDKAFLKDCENKALEDLIKHLVEEGPLGELFTISKTAEHVAKLLGSAWAFLEGEHLGLKWSGDPA
jgi:hypothetical protein